MVKAEDIRNGYGYRKEKPYNSVLPYLRAERDRAQRAPRHKAEPQYKEGLQDEPQGIELDKEALFELKQYREAKKRELEEAKDENTRDSV